MSQSGPSSQEIGASEPGEASANYGEDKGHRKSNSHDRSPSAERQAPQPSQTAERKYSQVCIHSCLRFGANKWSRLYRVYLLLDP